MRENLKTIRHLITLSSMTGPVCVVSSEWSGWGWGLGVSVDERDRERETERDF